MPTPVGLIASAARRPVPVVHGATPGLSAEQEKAYTYKPYTEVYASPMTRFEEEREISAMQANAPTLPNYEKLLPWERGILEGLPRVKSWWSTQPEELQRAGEALAATGGAIGKVIGPVLKPLGPLVQGLGYVLDAAAEGVERASGMARQALQASRDGTLNEFMGQLGEAWRARTLPHKTHTRTPRLFFPHTNHTT